MKTPYVTKGWVAYTARIHWTNGWLPAWVGPHKISRRYSEQRVIYILNAYCISWRFLAHFYGPRSGFRGFVVRLMISVHFDRKWFFTRDITRVSFTCAFVWYAWSLDGAASTYFSYYTFLYVFFYPHWWYGRVYTELSDNSLHWFLLSNTPPQSCLITVHSPAYLF